MKKGKKLNDNLSKIGKAQCALVIVPVEILQDTCNKIVENMIKHNDLSCFYIALNKPQTALEKIFKQKGINTKRIFYIDCITAAVTKPKEEKNILFVPNPAELGAIRKAIGQLAPVIKDAGFIFIDALRTLLIYNTQDQVINFVSELVTQARTNNMKTVFITTSGRDEGLMEQITKLFDKTITIVAK